MAKPKLLWSVMSICCAWSPKSLWTILDSLRYSECLPSIVVRNASIQRIEENKSIAGSLIFFARYLQCVNIWVRFLKTCYGTNVRFNHKVHCTVQLTKGFCWEAQFQNITAPPEISCYSREKKLCCGLTAQMASFFGEVVTGSYRFLDVKSCMGRKGLLACNKFVESMCAFG